MSEFGLTPVTIILLIVYQSYGLESANVETRVDQAFAEDPALE